MGALALAAAVVLVPAPVFVETAPTEGSAETRSLRDQLMLRLLEEGYPLAPSADQATRTLRVEPTPDGIRVQAHGEDTRRFEVATGPVLPLEAVHRAMEALDEVTPRATPLRASGPRVAVHVGTPPPSTSSEALRRTLVHRLLGRDHTVVSVDDEPDAVLCVDGRDDALALSTADDADGCGPDPDARLVALDDAEPDPEALDASLDALLTADDPTPRRPPVPAVRPRGTTPAVGLSTERTAPPEPRGPAVRLGARAGVYGRLTAADAAVASSLRVGGEPGPGGLLDVLMVPASAPDISIFETSVSGGFGWMFAVTPVMALHLQGLAGVQIHRFRQRGAEAGVRVDWTAEVPVGASLRVARGLRIDLSVRAGRSGRDREHRVDDVVVWSRSAWRIGGSVGLSYGWRTR